MLLADVVAAATKRFDAAENLEADRQLRDAADAFGKNDKEYMPVDVAKDARAKRLKILQGDAYKAGEELARAKELIEKGARDKAIPILERIVSQYGSTPAAEEARHLLTG